MIEYLSGKVLARHAHSLVIDVNGVGYGVEMPLSTLCEMPDLGEHVAVWIDTYVREDALRLFGFATNNDKQAFIMLRSVSGIGPKIALAVLSCLDASSLRHAVLANRVELLESVPGIGRRTAEKMIIELRPKMEKFGLAGLPHSETRGGKKVGASKASKSIEDVTLLDQFEQSSKNARAIDTHMGDLKSALENLGYKDKDISPVISSIYKEYDSSNTSEIPNSFQALLKTALKVLRTNQ